MAHWFSKIFSSERTGVWAVLILALVLLLQYLVGWYVLQVVRISKEHELGHHLADFGQLAPSFLAEPLAGLNDLVLDATLATGIKAGNPFSASAPDPKIYRQGLNRDLTDPLQQFADKARLNKVVLIDDRGLVLYDSLNSGQILKPYDFWQIDEPEIEQAFKGRANASPAYATENDAFKRYYVPIHEPAVTQTGERRNGPVRSINAVLCLIAGRTYLGSIEQLARAMKNLNMFMTVLMVGVAALVDQLMRRQRRMQRQAAEADRLAGLGTLAAGFAHELRNPLEIIRAFTEDLERSLSSGIEREEAAEACAEIIEEVDRMNRLVGQFLSTAHGDLGPHEPAAGAPQTKCLETVESVLAMLRPSVEKRAVTLELRQNGNGGELTRPWAARMEAGGFRQILINLILNAVEASPPHGRVTVQVQAAARQIELKVIDEGPGIAKHDRQRIFEPFYSTRPTGSGLGLAISRRIAVEAGGTLKLAPSPPDSGACLVLTLPRVEDDAPNPTPPPRKPIEPIEETFMPPEGTQKR